MRKILSYITLNRYQVDYFNPISGKFKDFYLLKNALKHYHKGIEMGVNLVMITRISDSKQLFKFINQEEWQKEMNELYADCPDD